MTLFIALLVVVYLSSGGSSNEFDSGNYIINSENCTVPDLPAFTPDLYTFAKTNSVSCSDFSPPLSYTTVENHVARLHIRNAAVTKYFGSKSKIRCCYSYVYRNGSVYQPDVGVTMSKCIQFEDSVELIHDTVWISCIDVDSPYFFLAPNVYENIHQVVKLNDHVRTKAEKLKRSSSKKPLSVLMMVIDSVSRLNFIRTMPKTRKFILENDFYEFKGYNKVDDNTFPNAMAFLAGMNLNDSFKICKPNEVDGLINCQIIWYNYRDLGYATAYAEDWSQIATFNYFKRGFKDNPTDYYFKPYMDAVTFLRTKFLDTMPFCAGPESQGDRILNLAYDFATTLKGLPSFGVFWMNTFSHNEITAPKVMDQNVRDFFQKLKSSGILNESMVMLLSDHGIRFGDIVRTARGFYEERLPMNYVSLPDWFKEEFPKETKNFAENTGKLTSNYDLYMTLRHVLVLSGLNLTANASLGCPDCRSLFEHIPIDRDCPNAGIPEKWCTCNGLPETVTPGAAQVNKSVNN